jgi:site-specific DNA-methyltransferase (adenine-specific)
VCASRENAKCQRYYTKEKNGLAQDWSNEVVFMNPPYGRAIIYWMKKAYEESTKGATVVCLVPCRTDTRWFHDWVYGKAELRFVRGRLKFNGKGSAPFPSLIAIYRGVNL